MILHKKLGLSKVSALWVPHLLRDGRKRVWVTWCHKHADQVWQWALKTPSWILLVTTESWIYCFDREIKQQSGSMDQSWRGATSSSDFQVPSKNSNSRHPSSPRQVIQTFWAENAFRDSVTHRTVQTWLSMTFSYFHISQSNASFIQSVFESPETVTEAFIQHMEDVSAFDWSRCFQKWFERMQSCIRSGGGVLWEDVADILLINIILFVHPKLIEHPSYVLFISRKI